MEAINSATLRLLWSVVEDEAEFLTTLNDDAVRIWILRQLKDMVMLMPEEVMAVNHYVDSKLNLIRALIAY